MKRRYYVIAIGLLLVVSFSALSLSKTTLHTLTGGELREVHIRKGGALEQSISLCEIEVKDANWLAEYDVFFYQQGIVELAVANNTDSIDGKLLPEITFIMEQSDPDAIDSVTVAPLGDGTAWIFAKNRETGKIIWTMRKFWIGWWPTFDAKRIERYVDW